MTPKSCLLKEEPYNQRRANGEIDVCGNWNDHSIWPLWVWSSSFVDKPTLSPPTPNPLPHFPPSTNNVGLQCGLLGIVLDRANRLACMWVQWGGATRQNKTTIATQVHVHICVWLCVCVCVHLCVVVSIRVCDQFSKKPTTIGGRCATWHAHQQILYSKRVSKFSLSLSLSLSLSFAPREMEYMTNV
jgi:hypothetical protein